ncbi:MAG: helix-hairpin-helix domain-containing protein [Gaiellaceae bacterium]
MDNATVAARLDEYAALLELAGAGYYSARAYRRAAELIRGTPAPIAELVHTGRVRELRGIGPGIETRLRELVETGEIAELRELERRVSPELAAFGRLIGIGAQRATAIGQALGLRTADELCAAAAQGRLLEVPGIGPKTEARIVAALERGVVQPTRPVLLHRARELVEHIADELGGVPAGDPRRWKDASTRLAVVAHAGDLASVPGIVALVAPNVGITVEGIPVELHVASPESFGTALVRATGSEEYVAALGPLPDAPDEETVFELLGLPFVPPELREGLPTGEVPELVTVGEIRGDLHMHTTWSDGKASVLEMGEAARARGYEYVAICDHTPHVTVVPGLDADALRRQGVEIAAANAELEPFRVLRGAECDIRRDGTLDLPDDVLEELEWVQLSLHAGQRAERRELTARVVAAMRHPAVRCLSHPTGRLIGHRPENALDLERVFEVALETGVALEVNGLPSRLDLSGEHVREALAAGVRIVCSTDAHSVEGLGRMELSVHTARRGGARAADVLNTGRLTELLGGRTSA